METPRRKEAALFLPFMQIPTGHHHVADALITELQTIPQEMNCVKIDILSYSYGKIERLVSSSYLRWIRHLPKAYDRLYDFLAVQNETKRSRQYLYEALFISYFKKLLRESNPRILFCTHALPSNMASVLKQKGKLDAVTVNVYTDFFVNRVWGIAGIDYHFVPSIRVKEFLVKLGVDESAIFVTGIPTHPAFQKGRLSTENKKKLQVLVTGGSLGVGALENLIPKKPSLYYTVLCGKNDKLYKRLKARQDPHITPISYVESKEMMNELYDHVDAVVTKPGGVTITECLRKKKPIFSCDALPGQEKVNERELKELGLIQCIEPNEEGIEKQVLAFFEEREKKLSYMQRVEAFHEHLEERSLRDILQAILQESSANHN